MLINSAVKNPVMTTPASAACVRWYVNTDVIIRSTPPGRPLGVRIANMMMLVSERRK